MNIVKSSLTFEVYHSQAYRTKKKPLKQIQGTYIEQYAKLSNYCAKIKRTNPGSTLIMKTELVYDKLVFEMIYIYICCDACKKGFLFGCRAMVGLDGCHFKGPPSGQLLTVIGINPNNKIFPICYAIVVVESKDSWFWFLQLLIEILSIKNLEVWAFINDKQKIL